MTVEISTLGNGLRVASLAMPGLETAAVGLYVDAGSRFEAVADNGVAHLLEHMVFKGTRSRSARQIAEEIEAVGGHLNAYTGRDATTFYARILADDLPLGVDMVCDLVANPLLDAQETAKEKDVVLQELGQAWDTPDDIIFDHLQAAAYADQPLGRSILGTEASIRALSVDALSTYRESHYRGGSLVLAAAGKVDHAALVTLAQDKLGALPAGTRPSPQAARYTGGDYRDDRPGEQVHVTLGLEAVPVSHADYFPLMLFTTALGGGMSSRLFQSVREERGLVYSVYSYATAYADSGLFTVYLGTGPETVDQAVNLSVDEIRRAVDDLAEAELVRARAQAKAALFMSLESCSALSEQIGRHLLLFNRPIPTAETIAQIDAVTLADARGTAARMLVRAPVTLATVGPSASVPAVELIQRKLA
jgi:predicted Zn-dependent peptidase